MLAALFATRGGEKEGTMTALEWVTRRLAREFAKQVRTGRYSFLPDVEALVQIHALLTLVEQRRMDPDEATEFVERCLNRVADPKLKAGLLALLA